jgi:CheY-like chemotaxis protein
MTIPVALAFGFGAGVLVALAGALLLRGRGASPKPTPSRPASPDAASQASETSESPEGARRLSEREVAGAWMQFLRREVTDTVNAINSRLTVVKALLAGLPREEMALLQRETLDRVALELERAVSATAMLHGHVSSTAPEPARPSVTAPRPHVVRTGVILVVESDDTTRDVIGEVFRCAGHRVLPARNGIEAFALLEREPVDCVISETRMSRLSGEGLYAQVEQHMPHLARRFVFIAGDTQDPEVREFLDRTGCLLIPKPFDVELLVEAVDEVIEAVAATKTG